MDLINYYQMIAPFKMAALRGIMSNTEFVSYNVSSVTPCDDDNNGSLSMGFCLKFDDGNEIGVQDMIEDMNNGIDPFEKAVKSEDIAAMSEEDKEAIIAKLSNKARTEFGDEAEDALNQLMPLSSRVSSFSFSFSDSGDLVLNYELS